MCNCFICEAGRNGLTVSISDGNIHVPGEAVALLCHGQHRVTVAIMWLINAPESCPQTPSLALSALSAVIERLNAFVEEQESTAHPGNEVAGLN